MDAVKFPQATKNMGAPPGFTKEEVFDLPVNEGFYFIRGHNPVACLTSCWELSDEDWIKWLPTDFPPDEWKNMKPKEPRIYLNIMGFGMPPVSLSIENPCGHVDFLEVGKYFHTHGVLPPEYLAALKKETDAR